MCFVCMSSSSGPANVPFRYRQRLHIICVCTYIYLLVSHRAPMSRVEEKFFLFASVVVVVVVVVGLVVGNSPNN